MSSQEAEIDSEGRLVIPENLRRELGLEAGCRVTITPRGRDLLVRKVDAPPASSDDARESARADVSRVQGSIPAMRRSPDDGEPSRPVKTLEEIAGRLRPLRPMSNDFDDEIEDAIADAMAEKYPWAVRREPSSPPD